MSSGVVSVVCVKRFASSSPPRILCTARDGGMKFSNGQLGGLLAVLFGGVYFGSSILAKRLIIDAALEEPSPPKYFRDIKAVSEDDEPRQ